MSTPQAPATASIADQLKAKAAEKEAQQAKTPPAPAPAPAQKKSEDSKTRVFYGDFSEYANFVNPTGGVLGFYRGYFTTEDSKLAEFALQQAGVVEVTGKVNVGDLPKRPTRERNRNWAAQGPATDPSVINPLELMQRAIGNTTHTPQAGDSNSTESN